MVGTMHRLSALWLVIAFSGVAGAALHERDLKNRPISKVVTLLKDMVTQLSKEGEEDEEVYEAFGCWCKTNDAEKTKAIADGNSRVQKLNAEIEKAAGGSAMLNTEIENLNHEVGKNQEALDTATALRQKQLAEFSDEEKDMLRSIGSLGSAVTTLSKTQKGAFLQVSAEDEAGIITMLQHELRRHKNLLAEIITPTQRRVVESFIQSPDDYFDGIQEGSRYNPAYKPQGGAIFGILGSMKETFETNLAKSQEEESMNQQAFEDLKAAKTAEIKAGQDQTAAKTQLLAETDSKHAQAKKDRTLTEETLKADTKYLASVKENCASIDQEYEERVKTRQGESAAVSKALAFLTSDDAGDLFAKSLALTQTSFLQVQDGDARRAKVASVLQAAAEATHDPRLAGLALRSRLDAFGKVKESLEGMIDKLLKEKDDEIAKKDFCIDSINQNLRTTETRNREKANAIAKIDDHANDISQYTKKIEVDHAQIAEFRVQLKKATEEREAANKDFQDTVSDQRATQKLLSATLNVLSEWYNKPALVQSGAAKRQPAGPPPPPAFKSYSSNGQSGGVMNMIQTIMDDAKAMESEALSGETTAQQAYEDCVKNTNDAVLALQKDITEKTELKARNEQDKVSQESTRDEKQDDIDQLMKENLDFHYSCDYMIKNFDLRMEARDAEVEALKQGIATFSGSSFLATMQTEA